MKIPIFVYLKKIFTNSSIRCYVQLIEVDKRVVLKQAVLKRNYSKSTFILTKSVNKVLNCLKLVGFNKTNDIYFQRTTFAKYLEVLLDSTLDWSS